MDEWQRVKVSDVCRKIIDCVNRTAPVLEYPTEFRMIRTTNIRHGRIDLANCKYVDEPTFRRWTRRAPVEDGDVILTREAPIGEVGYIQNLGSVFLGQRIMQFKPDPKIIDPRFLFFAFRSPGLQHQFGIHEGSGSVVSHIRVADCFEFSVPLPSLTEQYAIALLLGALDDKIELNRRMNETLEAMARAIFKDWFVDFGPTRAKMEGRDPYLAPDLWTLFPDRLDDEGKPEGWESGILGAVATAGNEGVDPTSTDPGTPYIGLEHMPRGSIALNDWEGAGKVSSNKSTFAAGDFLFGKLRPYFHKVGIAPVSGICSTDIVVVRPKALVWSGYVIACISSSDFVSYTDKTSTGTKMPRTSWSMMAKYPLVVPPIKLAKAFNVTVAPMLERICVNIHESRTLAQTRDLLLPKLMSGEIRVKEAEKLAEAVA